MNETPPIAYLEVHLDGQDLKFEVGQGLVCRIGRATRNTIVLSSSQVSRDHALIDCPNGKECYVTDTGSLNGTYVNGVRISAPALLRDGDVVGVGEFRLNFHHPAAPDSEWSESHSETVARLVNAEITVLVVDIRNYTGLSHQIGLDKLSEVVGCFMRESGTLLRAHGSWGQKYIGDAVMAIWVHNPGTPGDHFVRKALLSAYSIDEIAGTLQRRFALEEPVRVGAGINTGLATLGNPGGYAAVDYTALGDTVNKAFRLESETKVVPCDVLIGKAAFDYLQQDAMQAHFIEKVVTLKGYAEPQPSHAVAFETLAAFLGVGRKTVRL